jgi:hypothetical protein
MLQGTALGRGPLLLHLPMRMLATIRQRAAAALPAAAAAAQQAATLLNPGAIQSYDLDPFGSTNAAVAGGTIGSTAGGTEPCSMNAAAFAQLLLDMHRQAGVMLLDRMGDSVVQHMAAHVEVAVQVGAGTCLYCSCDLLLDRMGDIVVQHMAAHVEVAVQVGAVT